MSQYDNPLWTLRLRQFSAEQTERWDDAAWTRDDRMRWCDSVTEMQPGEKTGRLM